MYRLRVMVNGRPIPIYNDAQGRKWIEAREGTKFEVKVENDNYTRFLAVISVDGLNVINAKHEDPKKAPGYIVDSKSSISIPGWLVDENKTREFVFTEKGTAYANKIGADASNIGVIGCAVFREKISWLPYTTTTYNWYYPNYKWGDTTITGDLVYRDTAFTDSISSETYSVFNSPTSSEIKTTSLGVGSGEKVNYQTTTSTFERMENPETVLEIFYDDRQGLLDRGIILEEKPLPRAFPVGQNIGYCPDV